jgi:hypothetical protein
MADEAPHEALGMHRQQHEQKRDAEEHKHVKG